ncbi:MAG: hypothetical protein KatS3mg027_1595 [Bacteroidia bacterium]|nr:MAG: hypothetical protein KatS3mg027_1595 [Bacteroidia bacterium]
MKKVFIIFLITINTLQSQNIKVDTIYKDSVPIKILYDNKIYKLNAGFFTIGTGSFSFQQYILQYERHFIAL